jgi:cell division protein FtsL
MIRRSSIGQHGKTSVRRERDRRALRRQVALLACGMLTACGFVFAAGQRFVAVRYGYGSEQLREERARLVSERERLLLELNEATAPGTLEQAARGIGMQPARPSQIGDARPQADAQLQDAAQVSSRPNAGRQAVIEAGARVGSTHRRAVDGAHAHAVAVRER